MSCVSFINDFMDDVIALNLAHYIQSKIGLRLFYCYRPFVSINGIKNIYTAMYKSMYIQFMHFK